METFTICYSGTECFLDQALVMRKPKEMASYNPSSGYIPSKIFSVLTQSKDKQKNCVTMNGCGSPYAIDNKSLPIRVWSVDEDPNIMNGLTTELNCFTAPDFALGSLTGREMEVISIASIAKMLGVTLHLVPVGQWDYIKGLLKDGTQINYSQEETFSLNSLAYPLNNSMWNKVPQATSGNYCLRWSKADNEIIESFCKIYGTVVLLGHSRGGVSCLIAANYIAEWFEQLKIKIAALDPVPGPGNWWEVLTHIPATKDMEYVGIYAIDETSEGFNGVVPRVKGITTSKQHQEAQKRNSIGIWDPLDPNNATDISDIQNWSLNSSQDNKNQYTLIYTRGRHATIPGSRSLYGQGETDENSNAIGSSGDLVNAYVINKLIKWGVKGLTPIDEKQINLWIQTMNAPKSSESFKEMRQYNYGKITRVGVINGELYFNARGISSSNGRNRSEWNYLEAFIQFATEENFSSLKKTALTQTPHQYNEQRGLGVEEDITIARSLTSILHQFGGLDEPEEISLRESEYPSLGGTKKVYPWVYLADTFLN